MPFYTISADYMGGTYISQVRAKDANQAAIVWAEQLEVKDVPNLGLKSKAMLIDELRREQIEGHGPVPLNGVINVWCKSLLIRDKLLIINIIKTDESGNNQIDD